MKTEDILSHVDHTLLKAAASWEEIRKLCDEAMEYRTASVCVPSCYVKKIRENYPRLTICTVVGFPLGNGNSESKAAETIHALDDGADEIDMVINIGKLKEKNYSYVENEIAAVKKACEGKILKVIIETCLLTAEEKIKMCEIVSRAGADFIKTSTGFSSAGAKPEDIVLFKKHVSKNVKIKAAGGISSLEDAWEFINLGADRLGTSRIVKILKNQSKEGQN